MVCHANNHEVLPHLTGPDPKHRTTVITRVIIRPLLLTLVWQRPFPKKISNLIISHPPKCLSCHVTKLPVRVIARMKQHLALSASPMKFKMLVWRAERRPEHENALKVLAMSFRFQRAIACGFRSVSQWRRTIRHRRYQLGLAQSQLRIL